MISRTRVNDIEDRILKRIECCLSAIGGVSSTDSDEHAANAVNALVSALSTLETLKEPEDRDGVQK